MPAWMGRDAEDVIGYYRFIPEAKPLLAAADGDTAAAIMQALRDALCPHQCDGGVILGSAAWLVTARR